MLAKWSDACEVSNHLLRRIALGGQLERFVGSLESELSEKPDLELKGGIK